MLLVELIKADSCCFGYSEFLTGLGMGYHVKQLFVIIQLITFEKDPRGYTKHWTQRPSKTDNFVYLSTCWCLKCCHLLPAKLHTKLSIPLIYEWKTVRIHSAFFHVYSSLRGISKVKLPEHLIGYYCGRLYCIV